MPPPWHPGFRGLEPARGDWSGRPDAWWNAELAKPDSALAASPYPGGSQFSQADIAYVPWIIRAEPRAGVDLDRNENLREWLGRLIERRSVTAELDVVTAIAT